MKFNIILVSIIFIIILICGFGIVIAIKFQRKQRKKYNDIADYVNKHKDVTFKASTELNLNDIARIDSEVDVGKLTNSLYFTYTEFENKMKKLDPELDDLLYGNFKDYNISKIQSFKNRNYNEVNDNIELIGYSITDYSKEKLKFRVNINCLSYKMNKDKLVSGSCTEKVEKIILLEYVKINDKWLITSYDKIFERKLSK